MKKVKLTKELNGLPIDYILTCQNNTAERLIKEGKAKEFKARKKKVIEDLETK